LSPAASSRPGIAVTQTNGRDKREPAAGGAGRQEARDRHTEESHGDTADTHVRTRTHLHTRSSTSRCRATFPHPPPPNTHMANQLLRSGRRGQCTAHPRGSENAHASAHGHHDHPPPQVPEWLLESDTTAHDDTRAHDDTARSRVRVREQMAHQTSTAAGVRAEEASEKKSTNHRRRRPSRGHPFLPCRPSSRTCPCPPSLFNTGTHSHSLLHLSSYPRSHLMASRSLQAMQTPEPMSERRLLPDQPATSSLQVGIACATIQCRSNEQRSLLLFTALYPSSPPSRRAPSVYEALLHSKTVFARPHTSRLCLRVFSNFIVKK